MFFEKKMFVTDILLDTIAIQKLFSEIILFCSYENYVRIRDKSLLA